MYSHVAASELEPAASEGYVSRVNDSQRNLVARLSEKYIWWVPARPVLDFPARVISQVMELGTFEDIRRLEQAFGEARLAEVLRNAEPGWFSARSWRFWHYRLGLAREGQAPPPPERVLE